MAVKYEVIVVGSGFGGAVTACRLAEANRSVLVLERGRCWKPEDYPRAPGDPWLYDADCPHKRSGWLEFRIFRHMVVAAGAGVGGGSLAYANVSAIPPEDNFASGWPPEITFAGLQAHYQTVGAMLDVQEIPDNQVTKRFKLVKEAAEAIGDGARFRKLPIAISFDPNWSYDLDDPFSPENSRPFRNAHGVEQGTCTHTGECDVGCQRKAKNTLDMNYLARAEQLGAEIRPLHQVRCIEKDPDGWRVHYNVIDLEGRRRTPASEAAPRVVLSAGSMGSTEILLRSRDVDETLPGLPTALGHRWSSNGDFLTPANYGKNGDGRVRRLISPTHGPTITCKIDYLDGEKYGQERYVVEDGGMPPLLRGAAVEYLVHRALASKSGRARALLRAMQRYVGSDDEFPYVMPWFANGQDAADGQLRIGRPWYAPWRRKMKMTWEIRRSKELIDRIIARHEQLAEATGGKARAPIFWRLFHDLITPHPLGGCNMASDAELGVVDHRSAVFGHPGLYVIDGAMIPEAIGINPSRTIAAVSERSAGLLLEEMGTS